jgi:hypothetical protein
MIAFWLIFTNVWCFLHCSSYIFYSSSPSLSSPIIIPTIPHHPHGSYHLVVPCHVDHHPHCHPNILSLLVKPIWDIPQTKKLHINPFFLPRMFKFKMYDQYMSHLGMSFQDLNLVICFIFSNYFFCMLKYVLFHFKHVMCLFPFVSNYFMVLHFIYCLWFLKFCCRVVYIFYSNV